jgi:hypothetical protein
MFISLTLEYELPDDLELRQAAYGTTNPDECAQIDQAAMSTLGVLDWFNRVKPVPVALYVRPVTNEN